MGGDRVRTDAIISAVKLENAINSTQSLRRNGKEKSAHIVSPGGGVTYITVIDGFYSIFSLWQLEGKASCDVDIDQSAGSMVM